MTQCEFAELLGIGERTVKLYEKTPHRCPQNGAVIKLLWAWLNDPELRERLRRAGWIVEDEIDADKSDSPQRHVPAARRSSGHTNH